ncbi:universal stress protein [Leptolyngbya sp. FACHB-261]|uniref:universal stress protein n=1 Tax=Leptolyngbya sp. FACHB-261 TaxID=2692806 RepID=UPI001686F2FE|nr:universal stress protein [Leptolyngbya sp. FACHB-261]MBD2100522.1 universal stress protein [Leptolyngbya sp. FACHB-261]
MFHKILVALDAAKSSQRVFSEALAMAQAMGAQLMLLHVLSPDEEGSPDISTFSSLVYYPGLRDDNLKGYLEQWEAFEQRNLELLRSRATEAAAVGVTAEFSQNTGSPSRTICDLARIWGADLIIMGRRGRSGWSEALLGSVSNYVNHHAPCSVLTIQGASGKDIATADSLEVQVPRGFDR